MDQIGPLVEHYFTNAADVLAAYRKRVSPPSPLLLRDGLEIHASTADPTLFLFYEVFINECYTGGAFYRPQPTDIVFDVGANIGMFTLFVSAKAPGIRVHCFEPSADTRTRLLQNISRNRLDAHVVVHPYALFGDNGARSLHGAATSAERSLLALGRRREEGGESVACLTLADAYEVCGVEAIDFLKIDVEGAELEMLEGADRPTLRKAHKIALEFHERMRPGSLDRILAVLRSADFDAWVERNPYWDALGIGIVKATRGGATTGVRS